MNGKHILFYILDAYNMKSIYNVLHVFLMNPAQSKPKTDLYCSETNIHVIYTKFPEQLPYFFPQFNNHSQRPTAAQEAVFIQSDIPGWCFSEGGKCQSSVTTSWKWCLRLTPAEPRWGKMREWKVWFLPDVVCFCVCCRCTLRLPAQPTTTGTHRVIPPPNLPVLASQALSLCQVITFTHIHKVCPSSNLPPPHSQAHCGYWIADKMSRRLPELEVVLTKISQRTESYI